MAKTIFLNQITIRAIKRQDATEVGMMAKELGSYLRALGDNTDFRFNAKSFLRDGFGRNRAICGLIAEVDGRAAGYSLFHDGYDTDKGYRIIYLADLYVRPEYRGTGLGRKLIETVKDAAKRRGAKKIFWTVYAPNRAARKFYWHIGARYSTDMLEMKLPIK
jgi:GNAT superfamily N-acetyltransferase